jgi:hypothetical protein
MTANDLAAESSHREDQGSQLAAYGDSIAVTSRPPGSSNGGRTLSDAPVNLLPPATARVSEMQSTLTAQIGDTAKWLIAATAAVAAIVLAGIHVSDIASIHGSRFWTAIAMVALSLVAVLLAIWSTSRVLMPPSLTISVLCQPKSKKIKSKLSDDPLLNEIDICRLPDERDKSKAKVDEQQREFDEAHNANDPMTGIYRDRLLVARENAAAVDRTIAVVEALARYYETRRRFRRALWTLAFAAIAVFVAAPVFVVATTRVAASQSVPSCRYAATVMLLYRKTTDPSCPVVGEAVVVIFTPTGRQAYEHEASAVSDAKCTISKEGYPIGLVSNLQPVSIILLEANRSRAGPCITDQVFILHKNFGTISKYPFTELR